MNEALSAEGMAPEQDQRILEVVKLERARLKNFIRRRVPDERDAEDILQDVFYELVEAYRMMKPIERVSAWLYRVARNRITDLFRKKRPEGLGSDPVAVSADGESCLRICSPLLMRGRRRLMPVVYYSTNSMPLSMSCPKSSARYSSRTRWRAGASKSLLKQPA
jgi:RNA polymerase sigma factor (sigma-70 family)